MATTTLPNGIKVQTQHDYISLRLGNGRTITCGRSGEKFTGDIPAAVSRSFIKMIDAKGLGTLGERIPKWATETLPVVWPEWNVAPVEPTLGMKIEIDNGKGRAAWRGVHQGEVVKLARRKGGRHDVRFPYGLQAMTSGEIACCKIIG